VKAKRRRQRTVRPRGVTQELFASGPAMVRLCFCRNRLDGYFSINRLNVGGVTLGAAEMAEIVAAYHRLVSHNGNGAGNGKHARCA
jgi:hypothetical protein